MSLSRLVFRARYGIRLHRLLIIAFLSTLIGDDRKCVSMCELIRQNVQFNSYWLIASGHSVHQGHHRHFALFHNSSVPDAAALVLSATVTFEPPRDKTNKVSVRPAKTQISLGIRPVWSESSMSAWRKLGPLATHWAHSLIWVFAGRTATLLVLSRGGSSMVVWRFFTYINRISQTN